MSNMFSELKSTFYRYFISWISDNNSNSVQTDPNYSIMDDTSTWFTESPCWSSVTVNENHKELILPKKNSKASMDIKLEALIEKSEKFPRPFPVESVRCQFLKNKFSEEVLERNINSTYPVIHEHALYLCSMFLTHQKKFVNRDFYKHMTLLDLIERLLNKRAVCFLGPFDHYMLLDGTIGELGWDDVGTSNEKSPLLLKNCLSYDEMKLSALLSVSSHTCFINDGNRNNDGVFDENRDKIEKDGVIIGLIGTRLHKAKVMEYREIIKTKDQNNHHFGYGKFFVPTLQSKFSNFYGDISATYDELEETMKKSDRYVQLVHGRFFDRLTYSRRLILSIDTLLIEANDRAKKLNKMAYVHVVGLGLGVWKVYQDQDQIFMETFATRLELLASILTNISDICFAYIKHKMAGTYKHGDKVGNMKLHMIDKKGPHTKLSGEDEGKLLVVSYAWDSNALPGNEFWFGSLHTSSDPAAACSTQVAELHNGHINPKVSAQNLRVATLNGLVTFQEYQELHKDD